MQKHLVYLSEMESTITVLHKKSFKDLKAESNRTGIVKND